jgi:hypothetical protein
MRPTSVRCEIFIVPKLDSVECAVEDMDQRGLLKETLSSRWRVRTQPRLGVSTSGNANSPDGRDHWPIATQLWWPVLVLDAVLCMANQMQPAAARRKPVHPIQLTATIYHSLGLIPHHRI